VTPISLQLVYRERRQRPARGVLLSGDDAGAWLRVLAAAEVPLGDVEFLPLPIGPADRRVRGALAVFSGTHAERMSDAGPLYGEIAGRLYLPMDGAVEPPVADGEWSGLLSDDGSCFVWHPAAGLIRIEPEERLRAADLIRPPIQREADWSRAVPGPYLNTRLLALVADEPPTFEQFLGTAGDGIGSAGDDLGKLPKGRQEPGPIDWRKLTAAPLQSLSSLMQWMRKSLSQSPPGASGGQRPGSSSTGSGSFGSGSFGPGIGAWLAGALGGGLGKMLDGMASAIARITPKILSERAREIERLLNRFDSDPDDALRYALPLAGNGGRGIAPPGSRLTPRSTDFSLGGTSGPVDAWGIPPELQTSLLARYREAAQREIRLGRYRRAAYIFSKLLGDDLSAASALEAGRFHREAAVLYRDRLRQPLEAARCLVRGGLLREAVDLYRAQERHVEAGDLLVRLKERDEANKEYRHAVESRLAHQDFLGAADLLARKLEVEEEAFPILERGWPGSSQAEGCLTKIFEGAARLGRHEYAAALVRSLRSGDLPASALTIVLERLPETALNYPDPQVQALAAEGVRVVAARLLADNTGTVDLPLRAIERLVPGDRLLGRDCRRYRPVSKQSSKAPSSPRDRRPRGETPICRLERTIRLQPTVAWLEMKGTAAGYFAAGTMFKGNAAHLILQRGTWEGAPAESLGWPLARGGGSDSLSILMTIEQLATTQLRLTALSAGRDPLVIPPLPFPDVTIDTPPWLARPGILAADSFAMMTWTVDENLDVRTIEGSGIGLPVMTRRLEIEDLPERPSEQRRAAIHVRDLGAWIAIDRKLFVMPSPHSVTEFDLQGPVTRIAGSGPHTAARVAILSESGGQLFLPTHGLVPLPADLRDPAAVFLRDGRLILWTRVTGSTGRFLVLSIGPAEWKIDGSCETDGAAPAAMVPTARPDEFASLQPGGQLEIWKVAPRR